MILSQLLLISLVNFGAIAHNVPLARANRFAYSQVSF